MFVSLRNSLARSGDDVNGPNRQWKCVWTTIIDPSTYGMGSGGKGSTLAVVTRLVRGTRGRTRGVNNTDLTYPPPPLSSVFMGCGVPLYKGEGGLCVMLELPTCTQTILDGYGRGGIGEEEVKRWKGRGMDRGGGVGAFCV